MRFICLALACVFASFSVASAQQAKKLIEFGWDEPNTAFMRKHIAEMEKTPFDGTVFDMNFKAADGSMQNYVWHCWSTRAFKESDFQQAIDDLAEHAVQEVHPQFSALQHLARQRRLVRRRWICRHRQQRPPRREDRA
jgi:hypothetical protein